MNNQMLQLFLKMMIQIPKMLGVMTESEADIYPTQEL